MIKFDRVTKMYFTKSIKLLALSGVSFEIAKGEFVAIMGPSGSGKTTLLNILGCLDKPSEGNYILDGESIEGMSPDELALVRSKKIGFIFQSYNLLPKYSALANVELGLVYAGVKSQRRKIARAKLAEMGLGDRLNHNPSELSGGQQQRVSIARALVKDPELLLADEPTGNIDTKTSDEVMRLLQMANQRGVTIILITHNLEVAQWADRTIFVRDGRIIDSPPKRRLHPRKKLKLLISVKTKESGQDFSAKMLDISKGGLSLLVGTNIAVSTKVSINLPFAGLKLDKGCSFQSINVPGEVLSNFPEANDQYRLGVSFIGLKDKEREVVEEFLK